MEWTLIENDGRTRSFPAPRLVRSPAADLAPRDVPLWVPLFALAVLVFAAGFYLG
jgi:hypothetical protein